MRSPSTRSTAACLLISALTSLSPTSSSSSASSSSTVFGSGSGFGARRRLVRVGSAACAGSSWWLELVEPSRRLDRLDHRRGRRPPRHRLEVASACAAPGRSAGREVVATPGTGSPTGRSSTGSTTGRAAARRAGRRRPWWRCRSPAGSPRRGWWRRARRPRAPSRTPARGPTSPAAAGHARRRGGAVAAPAGGGVMKNPRRAPGRPVCSRPVDVRALGRLGHGRRERLPSARGGLAGRRRRCAGGGDQRVAGRRDEREARVIQAIPD